MSTRMAIRVAPDTSVISPANVADRSACSTEVTHCASVAEAGALERVLGNLINAGRTHPAPGFGDLTRNALLHADVVGRVVAGGVAADEHRGELVEGVRAVGFDVGVLRVPHEHRRLVVAVPVRASWQLALADLLQAAQQAAEEQALLQRISKGKLPRSEEHTSELQSR